MRQIHKITSKCLFVVGFSKFLQKAGTVFDISDPKYHNIVSSESSPNVMVMNDGLRYLNLVELSNLNCQPLLVSIHTIVL